MDGWVGGWMGGWMVGWVGGWMDDPYFEALVIASAVLTYDTLSKVFNNK
jgi:hypothetical protein